MISKFFRFFFPRPKTELERITDLIKQTKSIKSLHGSKDDHFFTLDNVTIAFSWRGDKVLIKRQDHIMFVSENIDEIKVVFETLIAVSQELSNA